MSMHMSVWPEYTTATWMPRAPTPKDRSSALVIWNILETESLVQVIMDVKHWAKNPEFWDKILMKD